jgi:hypothetical protein
MKDNIWDAVRTVWEYDPSEPSLTASAQRAAEKHNFIAPSKVQVHRRMNADKKAGNPWERRSTLNGINQSAHRKADAMVYSDGERRPYASATVEQANRQESEDARAEVLARHRSEWRQIVALRQESIAKRQTDPVIALNKARLVNILAQTTKIQQEGERKAWGLDDNNFDPTKMSDDELERVVKKGG